MMRWSKLTPFWRMVILGFGIAVGVTLSGHALLPGVGQGGWTVIGAGVGAFVAAIVVYGVER
jgi:hypothetical protein